MGLQQLAEMEYPGRGVGGARSRDDKFNIGFYFATVRTALFQKRKLQARNDDRRVIDLDWSEKLTPEEEAQIISSGTSKENLIYPVATFSRGMILSNGNHINDVDRAFTSGEFFSKVLRVPLLNWGYEADPSHTPRIITAILDDKLQLGLLRDRGDGGIERPRFDYDLETGKGKWITTYDGPNLKLPPAFSGEPYCLDVMWDNHRDMAEAIYDALAPKSGGKDNRVSVLVAFQDRRTSAVEYTAIDAVNISAGGQK